MIGEQRKINSFFLILYFLSESLKAKTKTSKRDDLFYNTVLLKKPCFFSQTSTHLTWKITCSRNTANNRSDFANFHQTCFCLVSEKTFALHHFWTPKNCILMHFKCKCLYISVYIRQNIFIPET